jgi:drug/metabolite transporter (DMT)-like permease
MLLPLLLGPGIKKINVGLSFELGLMLFAAYQCQSRELVTESASEGSIMLAVYLLLVPLVELIFGRAFTAKKVVSLVVAVGGVALLALGAQPPTPHACSEPQQHHSSVAHDL